MYEKSVCIFYLYFFYYFIHILSIFISSLGRALPSRLQLSAFLHLSFIRISYLQDIRFLSDATMQQVRITPSLVGILLMTRNERLKRQTSVRVVVAAEGSKP